MSLVLQSHILSIMTPRPWSHQSSCSCSCTHAQSELCLSIKKQVPTSRRFIQVLYSSMILTWVISLSSTLSTRVFFSANSSSVSIWLSISLRYWFTMSLLRTPDSSVNKTIHIEIQTKLAFGFFVQNKDDICNVTKLNNVITATERPLESKHLLLTQRFCALQWSHTSKIVRNC